MKKGHQSIDVCVVCALPEEARAFLDMVRQQSHDGIEEHISHRYRYHYRVATLKNTRDEPLNVHISLLPRYGPEEMTLHLSRVLEECQPRIALMTGICAGDAHYVHLGDLVVAERTFTYDSGKFTLDEHGRTVHLHDTMTYHLDANILQFLKLFDDWQPLLDTLNMPEAHPIVCHIQAMASGSAVRADRPFEDIRIPVRGTVAIDMEGAAFGMVMSRYPSIPWLIVKGVSDYADQQKDDTYHEYAAYASALYALSFIRAYVLNERLPRQKGLLFSSPTGISHGAAFKKGKRIPIPEFLELRGFQGLFLGDTEVILPPMVSVEPGSFLLGSDQLRDKDAFNDEFPRSEAYISGFSIGKFPLTVAEYSYFLRATGHKPPDVFAGYIMDIPWHRQLSQRQTHPVVGISWFDAVKYAEWLSSVTGRQYRLPTESEWERAARGNDDRIYPWGSNLASFFGKDTYGNFREIGKSGYTFFERLGPLVFRMALTRPVGRYSLGRSACGCLDMAGNVWEWTSSLKKPYPYRSDDGREAPDAPGKRVVRGGSFHSDHTEVRAACRVGYEPDSVTAYIGARLACDETASS